MLVRRERPADAPAIHQLVAGAFRVLGADDAEPPEAALVDRLRSDGDLAVSLVAEVDGTIVGHVGLSPVTLDGRRADPPALGLAPLAVAESCRGRGVGSALVLAALESARGLQAAFVVVLGDPDYYARLGFEAAEPLGLTSIYDAGPAFRVCVLAPGTECRGLVHYAPAFDGL